MQKYFALIIAIFFPVITLAFTIPQKPTGFVQDYAGILSPDQLSTLEKKLENYERTSTNEIAVVIVDSLRGDTIENVAQEIFTTWGIGKKGKDNGVLLLISLSERKNRIQTGYGVEASLTDIGASYIQSDIIRPAFRNNDYYGGINGAVDKMVEALSGTNIVPTDYSQTRKVDFPWEYIFFAFIFLMQVVTSILARSKSWWGGGVLGGIAGMTIWHFFISSIILAIPTTIILILFGLFVDYLVSSSYHKARALGTYPWWMSNGRGGSGGGFGGFGGGGSGGGGSSGSW